LVARRKAGLSWFGRRVRRWLLGVDLCCEGCCDSLLYLEEERARLGDDGRENHAGTEIRHKRALEPVEVGRIAGSVGRSRAFDTTFLPACSCSKERWKSVDLAFREGKTLLPVELYRLGDDYFVADGNHRVSVARHRGIPAVEALATDLSPGSR